MFMYFVAWYIMLAMVFRSFLYTKNKNSPDQCPLVKAVTRILSSALSISSASLLNWVTYNLKLSLSRCLTFKRLAEDLLYHWPPMKCVTKSPLNSLKVKMKLGTILLNHTWAGPLSVVGKALHMISSRTPCRCMRVLNDSKWSRGSFDPSYASTYGILNLVGRGKDVIDAVKGELVRWTNSSKLVDTRPLISLIIISIFSFITYISCALHNVPTSNFKEQLVFCWSRLLAALLSSWSSLSWWSFVGGRSLLHSPLSCLSFKSLDSNHSAALTVVPTCGSVEWVVQSLWQGHAPAFPMH